MSDGFLSDKPEEIRDYALSYVRTHRDWDVRTSRYNKVAWNTLNIGIIVLGAATSLLVASGYANNDGPFWYLWFLGILMPALASLFSAILLQFNIFEKWRQREFARIALEKLICDAYLIPARDRDETLVKAIALRRQAHDIELDQADKHFGLTGAANSQSRGVERREIELG